MFYFDIFYTLDRMVVILGLELITIMNVFLPFLVGKQERAIFVWLWHVDVNVVYMKQVVLIYRYILISEEKMLYSSLWILCGCTSMKFGTAVVYISTSQYLCFIKIIHKETLN